MRQSEADSSRCPARTPAEQGIAREQRACSVIAAGDLIGWWRRNGGWARAFPERRVHRQRSELVVAPALCLVVGAQRASEVRSHANGLLRILDAFHKVRASRESHRCTLGRLIVSELTEFVPTPAPDSTVRTGGASVQGVECHLANPRFHFALSRNRAVSGADEVAFLVAPAPKLSWKRRDAGVGFTGDNLLRAPPQPRKFHRDSSFCGIPSDALDARTPAVSAVTDLSDRIASPAPDRSCRIDSAGVVLADGDPVHV